MFNPNEIVENVVDGKVLVVARIVEFVDVADGSKMARLVDVRDDNGASDKQLIARNKTFCVPTENLRSHPEDCKVCHKDGLVYLG